ncbi:hypothetical protein BK816_08470 [Boudabousia tangfeifanii]|uniref:EcsC protein family protein n=1 Tax=Boudabousia tangfeifanii TaxID=1912795 RepID=A0A1D9MLY5_9ACTO|nr:hypothetical protein [Boudabousia tangfeifanii]AOZ73306.1 hypothetical protein BK816_08470 [Boudabousia tangfeifanii]
MAENPENEDRALVEAENKLVESLAENPVTELSELTAEQDAEAVAFATEFLKKIIRLRGVKIERDKFLTQELHRLGVSKAVIKEAVDSTPFDAGVDPEILDQLAEDTIGFETKKSASISFFAGLPGGFAMAATIPGDVMQYYVHAFRVMQKLAYLYGWKEFLKQLDDVDDQTLGLLASFLGVMMGVAGASNSLVTFANSVARPAIQHQIAKQALTKTVWYQPVKQTLKLVGIKVTKDSLAKGLTKAVPLLGGAISGGLTLVSLRSQAYRLQKHLRKNPPPFGESAKYLEAFKQLDLAAEQQPEEEGVVSRVASQSLHAGNAALNVATKGVMGVASGLGGVASKMLFSTPSKSEETEAEK